MSGSCEIVAAADLDLVVAPYRWAFAEQNAAAIAAQGFLRLGKYLGPKGSQYTQAGLTIARTLFAEPYLS